MSVIDAEHEVVEEREPEADREEDERLSEALQSFVGELQKEADRRIGRRRELEQRWLRDLRQYHGVYEDKILVELRDQDKSELFLNVTRHKTNTASAKLSDMLFPTDDRNWAIEPTPVPELARRLERLDQLGQRVEAEANGLMEAGQAEQAQALVERAQPVLDEAARGRKVMEEAQRASEGMQREIDDQLTECGYAEEARRVIDDGCKLGLGVIKGPVRSKKRDQRWVEITAPDGRSMMMLQDAPPRMRAAAEWTDPWHWFPDPDAKRVEDSDSFFERHLDTESKLRKLARLPGYRTEAIERLLKTKPKESMPYWVADLRTITGVNTDSGGDVFHRWEWYGCLDAKRIVDLARAIGMLDMAGDYEDLVDELVEVPVCIEFCQGEIIKFAEHWLDTGEQIYSVWCWQEDDAGIPGYGVPYTMRDTQSAICAGWRMIMDNAGLSTAPQIMIDKTAVEPQDGTWDIRAGKVWLKTRITAPGDRVFDVFNLPANLAELMAIINSALKFIDDETGISQLAQGEQGVNVTKTAQGMAMLMNSTNVVFRRVVKAFDDNLTTPLIRRFYAWVMQWGEDPSIKGDMQVRARGSAVLLVREVQAQNMMGLLAHATGNPILMRLTKIPVLYRRAVQALQIPADDVILSDDEIAEMERQEAQQPPKPDPEMMKLETQKEIAQIEAQSRIQVANMNLQATMMKVAQEGNIELDKLDAMLERVRMEIGHKERSMAVETAMAERTGKSAGGAV